MSDLAPFVAAALRDRVVLDMQEEIRGLQQQLEEIRIQSQCVSITGPRGSPVYAEANFCKNGNYDRPELWKVEFPTKQSNNNSNNHNHATINYTANNNTGMTTTTRSSACCSLADLAQVQIRVGGICRAKMLGAVVEGFVNDVRNNYDPIEKSGAVSIWFGGSSGIWLTVRIQPLERDQYASLRDFDLGAGDLVSTLLHFFHDNTETIQVYFTEVSFLVSYMNGAMEQWGLMAPTDLGASHREQGNHQEPEEHGNDTMREDTDNADDEMSMYRAEV